MTPTSCDGRQSFPVNYLTSVTSPVYFLCPLCVSYYNNKQTFCRVFAFFNQGYHKYIRVSAIVQRKSLQSLKFSNILPHEGTQVRERTEPKYRSAWTKQ